MPIWLWFFALIVTGVFAGFLAYLEQYQQGEAPAITLFKTPENEKSKVTASASENKLPRIPQEKRIPPQNRSDNNTKFDFYSLLPEMEVLVPELEKRVPTIKPDALPKSPAEISIEQTSQQIMRNAQYFLQAGSFKTLSSADRRRADLAFLGIESEVESVNLASGLWHRVRVGPFFNTSEYKRVRVRMQSNNIDSILVRVNPKING